MTPGLSEFVLFAATLWYGVVTRVVSMPQACRTQGQDLGQMLG
jgi:hypothetical protein